MRLTISSSFVKFYKAITGQIPAANMNQIYFTFYLPDRHLKLNFCHVPIHKINLACAGLCPGLL